MGFSGEFVIVIDIKSPTSHRCKTDRTMNSKNTLPRAESNKRIAYLENLARRLEPAPEDRKEISGRSFDYVESFIDALPAARAYMAGECNRLRALPIEEQGKPFDELLDILREEVNTVGINSSSGAGYAYIPGGGLWASAIGDLLAAATNRYAGVYYSSPGSVIIENQMIHWLCGVLGYPATAHGNLSSGGSIANLTAIQTARDANAIDSTNVRNAVLYTTAHVHHCIDKALHTTGLDEAVHRIVPMNPRHQMDAVALEEMLTHDVAIGLRPFLVIATAGTTDAGAIDPLESIAALSEKFSLWFHVDAAYGGFFMLVDTLREKFRGIERSDSAVLDPHKGMFLPFGTGVVLVKDPAKLMKSFSKGAAYMQDAAGFEDISPADVSPELSKHFRGLRMWLPLHLHGVAPFRASLEEKYLLCRRFYEEVNDLGFETGPEPELSVALFRYPAKDPGEFNRKFLAALQADGRALFSSTEIDGDFWIRCAILNFRSHNGELSLALRTLAEVLKSMPESASINGERYSSGNEPRSV